LSSPCAALRRTRTAVPRSPPACPSSRCCRCPYGGPTADYARFRLERADYLAAIEAARAGPTDAHIEIDPPIFAFFNWGGMIWSSNGVAYDETDEAGKPEQARSEAWRARHVNSEFSCEPLVRSFGGHFYMVYAAC